MHEINVPPTIPPLRWRTKLSTSNFRERLEVGTQNSLSWVLVELATSEQAQDSDGAICRGRCCHRLSAPIEPGLMLIHYLSISPLNMSFSCRALLDRKSNQENRPLEEPSRVWFGHQSHE